MSFDPMVAPAPIPEQPPRDGAALLDLLTPVQRDYRTLVEQVQATRCNAERRRLLSRQRAACRAALTLAFTLAERDVEAAR